MDQDPQPVFPVAAGIRAVRPRGPFRGNHDVTRHETPEQCLLAISEVGRPHRHTNDAPSTDLRQLQPSFHQGVERRIPVQATRRGLESQNVHLPVALLAIEKSAASVQTRRRVRSQEHVGQRLNQAARREPRSAGGVFSQRARLFVLPRSTRNRTTRSGRPRSRGPAPRKVRWLDTAPQPEPGARRTPARASLFFQAG